jgi:8-oxo-dGTP pyrophosphatase MutT (NUDIX family)
VTNDAPPPLPPYVVRDSGDAWVFGPDGEKFWGRFGAAGLLVWHRSLGVLLQHRVGWSHFGGTWGLPGGARKAGESAVDGALREAAEEATVPPELLRILHTSVLDLGYWSYTTVVAEAMEEFEPVIADAESAELRWVLVDEVAALSLHPGFAAAWPELRDLLL